MDRTDIPYIIQRQREFFSSGKTLDVHYRRTALTCFQKVIEDSADKISRAVREDLNKHSMETYMTESGMVLDEIKYILGHFQKWAAVKRVKTPLAQFKASSFVVPEPYGTVLVMSPWNYPVQLSLEPVVGAVAAGNTVIIKPSAYAPASSRCIAEIVRKAFVPEHVAVVEGGREENGALLEQKFDYIFFTGSVNVGKLVMEKAASHLTPVSLELGGKSPVIIDKTADIKLAAKRTAFGKVLNAGQTCVAPDYVLIDREVKSGFIESYKHWIKTFFPDGYGEMPVIVNERHFDRIKNLVEGSVEQGAEIEVGAAPEEFNAERRFIPPVLLSGATFDMPVMQEEIFGPVLPVIEYESLDSALAEIKKRPKPLALYLFTRDKKVKKHVLETVSFGGGCVNDTIIHLATPYMGFGGVGNSGMGQYHGRKSFDTFTHYKSIVEKSNAVDLPMRYHPYTAGKMGLIKRFLG